MNIWNEDCIIGSKTHIKDKSIDLIICDPPFGIGESEFDKFYKRDSSKEISGYVEAPVDYAKFTKDWIEQAKRILKDNGSFYIISGWTNLKDILNAIDYHDFEVINHIIWKYNFGLATKTKFVTSHYHILYLKNKGAKVTFNTHCRFGPQERTETGGSVNYQDLEDVFTINKEFHQKELKNKNKLPNELIKKLIQYSSNEGDLVCDFFMGNFTTANVAHGLGRNVVGFELNKNSYECWLPIISQKPKGFLLDTLKKVEIIKPENQGKKIGDEERNKIQSDFTDLIGKGKSKKDVIKLLTEKYGRGRFSIKNITDSIPLLPKRKETESEWFFTT